MFSGIFLPLLSERAQMGSEDELNSTPIMSPLPRTSAKRCDVLGEEASSLMALKACSDRALTLPRMSSSANCRTTGLQGQLESDQRERRRETYDVEDGTSSSASDGVSGVGSTEGSRGHGGHDVLGGGDSRKREPVGEPLGEDHDVRLDVGGVLDVEELSGSSVTRLDLVDDEEDLVVVADLSKVLEVAGGGGDVSSADRKRRKSGSAH